jgi:hypothetical protein
MLLAIIFIGLFSYYDCRTSNVCIKDTSSNLIQVIKNIWYFVPIGMIFYLAYVIILEFMVKGEDSSDPADSPMSKNKTVDSFVRSYIYRFLLTILGFASLIIILLVLGIGYMFMQITQFGYM